MKNPLTPGVWGDTSIKKNQSNEQNPRLNSQPTQRVGTLDKGDEAVKVLCDEYGGLKRNNKRFETRRQSCWRGKIDEGSGGQNIRGSQSQRLIDVLHTSVGRPELEKNRGRNDVGNAAVESEDSCSYRYSDDQVQASSDEEQSFGSNDAKAHGSGPRSGMKGSLSKAAEGSPSGVVMLRSYGCGHAGADGWKLPEENKRSK